jgi:hypothetical protein
MGESGRCGSRPPFVFRTSGETVEILIMDKNSVQSLLVTFLLGVFLTLLLTSRPRQGPYIPFGTPGEQKILDTRDGRLYVHGQINGKEMWHVFVQGFYKR